MLTFEVPGHAVPKGRPRFGNGRTYTPAATVQWEATVSNVVAAEIHGALPIFKGNVCLDLTFYVHGRSGDNDNLQKAIQDALNGVLYADDYQIVETHTRRFACRRLDERVVISIRSADW
jgi:Holliday junction resolvase RusA-like endonuclease